MAACVFCQADNVDGAIVCSMCGSPTAAVEPGDSDQLLPPGTILGTGRYTVGKVLGQGGFGITYLGSDVGQRRPVAIKEFFPEGARRKGALVVPPSSLTREECDKLIEGYCQEAQLIARFDHPGIVRVYDVFRENQSAYMVMEYHAVPDLSDVLLDGPLNVALALQYVECVGAALSLLHEHGYLHRDVKPANILVYSDGRAVLIDFGTAREFTAGKTRRHTTMLTPGYAPLEQYTERAHRGPFTDVYSLAGTLYHMLSGQRPVAATDRAVGIELPRAQDLNPSVAAAVSAAIQVGMTMDPARRPQNVAVFLEALRAAPADPPPSAAAPAPASDTPTQRVDPVPAAETVTLPATEPSLRMMGHDALIHAVAVSSSANWIASGSWDTTVRLWDAATGKERWQQKNEHSGAWIWDVGFDNQERYVASASEDQTVRLLDLQTGQLVRSWTLKSKPLALSFSPDGQRLAIGGSDKAIRVVDPQTGRELLCLQEHTRQVTSVSFSPDGFLLVSGSEDGTVRLWEASGGRQLCQLAQGSHPSRSVRFSPDGKLVAAAFDTAVALWETFSAKEVQRLNHSAVVTSLSFCPQGSHLATATEERQVSIWAIGTGQVVLSLQPHGGKVMALAWAPRGEVLVSGGGDKMVRVWRMKEAATPPPPPPPPKVDSAAARPRTLDRPTGLFRGHWATVRAATFSPDGRCVITGGEDRTVRVWDTSTGRELYQLGEPTSIVNALHGAGTLLAVGSEDKSVQVFDLWSGERLARLEAHRAHIRAVAVSPDGRYVVSGANDGVVLLWDMTTGLAAAEWKQHTQAVTSIAFFPNGRRVLTASEDRTVLAWDVPSGSVAFRISGHSSNVCSVIVSQDGMQVFTASFDRSVRMWGRISGKEVRRFMGHRAPVRSLAVAPDGRWLVSGSDDRTLRFWDIESGQERHRLDLRTVATSLTCSPSGAELLWTCFEPTVRLLKLDKVPQLAPLAPLAAATPTPDTGSEAVSHPP